MDLIELEQLSTPDGMRELVKQRWVDAQASVRPHLERHLAAVRTLSEALADVDPNPKTYLDQVLRAKLAERQAWLLLTDARQTVGLAFEKACPLGSGFDWESYDQVWCAAQSTTHAS